jgi:hypothetical protein
VLLRLFLSYRRWVLGVVDRLPLEARHSKDPSARGCVAHRTDDSFGRSRELEGRRWHDLSAAIRKVGARNRREAIEFANEKG